MTIAAGLTDLAARFVSADNRSRAALFIRGRRNLLSVIARDFKREEGRKTLWFHASSLGEFAIARPLVERLARDGRCNVAITFFSPSGYEIVKKESRKYPNVFYLPWDSPKNARKFIDTIRPDAAVIMVSEYWHNYLRELHSRSVPTFLVSSLIRDDSVFFKPFGGDYRKDLECFTHIFTLDRRSVENLARLGCDRATQTGDPLFDNARAIAESPYENAVIERFCGGEKVFIAGSIDCGRDLDLVSALANGNPDTRFIIVPHAVDSETLAKVTRRLEGKTLLYSQADAQTGFEGVQNLVIDFVGALSRIYRFGTWAYVGGGFTPYLHSVIEAVVYGIPVAFGPITGRKVTPGQLAELGIGAKVSTAAELQSWFASMRDDAKLEEIRRIGSEYITENLGSTEIVAETIERHL